MENITGLQIVLQRVFNETKPEKSTIHRHPILHFVGIYALILIIIGTIGKENQ